MANEKGEIAVAALRNEIRQAIEDIRERKGTNTCKAHDSLSRGVIVLLRCEEATLQYAHRQYIVAGATATIVATVVGLGLKFLT